MKIRFHSDFEKQIRKLTPAQREKLRQRLKLFLDDQFNQQLNNHALKGKYAGYRSINIGGDLRAIYKRIDDEIYFFVEIGTHSKLYS